MNNEHDDEGASARGIRVMGMLEQAATKFGLRVRKEYPIPGGRLDVVWLWHSPIPGVEGDLPIVAFEIESSWRTRKHIKGDLLNLHDACPLVGVLVLLGDGPDVESTRRFASQLANRPGWRIVVWSEEDVEVLIKSGTSRGGVAAVLEGTVERPTHDQDSSQPDANAPVAANTSRHSGKYQGLWRWLLEQRSSPIVPLLLTSRGCWAFHCLLHAEGTFPIGTAIPGPQWAELSVTPVGVRATSILPQKPSSSSGARIALKKAN